MWSKMYRWLVALTVCATQVVQATPIQTRESDYFLPNSTGFRMQHGFETILVQPFGFDGFHVRAWPFRPPTGHEISFIYDPPLEGFENGQAHGLTFDTAFNGNHTVAIRNGNTIVRTSGWGGNPGGYRLAFYRVEQDGSETLLTNEYAPLKSINPRYYSWNGPGSEFSAEFSFSTTPNEQFYGTGTQQDHLVNKKGTVIDLINFNTHIPTPVFMSNKGYAFIWNMPAQGRMEFGQLRTKLTADSTTVVDYVIVATTPGDYDTLQKRLSALTGRAPTPPDFSLGYIQSKLRYENQTELELLAQKFKDNNVPVGMFVIDYQSWRNQGDWGLDPALWPDVAAMAKKVKDLTGAEIMASLWPSVSDASDNYLELQANGYLSATRDGPGTTDSWNGSYIRNVDSTNPGARKFIWSTLKRNYYDKGIKNFWIDQADGGALGEAYENNGQSTYIQSVPFALPNVLYAAGTQQSAGKYYPWAHQLAIEEGFRNVTDSKEGEACEHISLSRSGYIGSQRFCSMIWSGDTTSAWETLGLQIASGLSAAATGWGWWTMDAGGFQPDPTVPWSSNIDTPEYRELYVRWLQWATFVPFMRTHGQRVCDNQDAYTCNNEPWSYGEKNTPIILSYIHLRYQLASYLRALFDQFHKTGRMIMRPLYMDFEKTDPKVSQWTQANNNVTTQQYMFGPRLLVSPITTPNVTEWSVYLPQTGQNGTKPWTYWWTNQTYAGGQTVTVPAPVEHIPVFHLGKREDILSGNVF
ncbi:glycosyl hydrolases family 31-domain-containing protein [Aspergillus minisclerotigenes]|uniref:Glycosyl hydrolases family 31-domain-containing protein n=1 Tax=Aspergillus minisclerotigenes TaxID=656917 RepID=A0A5N6J312_9EURO|nr:glycosyl hydrolases family 31-domain-containing protein [Aspergillus minisclerotigenes]